ncbi:MAG: tRNA-intron lyase [Candidatus Pacearchaeota archaeon]|nr:tRNA-intron lyase [Candidatus Pacearchaeota archaeon]
MKTAKRMGKKRKTEKKEDKGKKREEKRPFRAMIVGDGVISEDRRAKDLHGKSSFGEIVGSKVHYSFVEAAYLAEKGKIAIYDGKKKIGFDAFVNRAKKLEPNFWTRFSVFRDIRDRGYIIKTALKFGADFSVYGRGDKPGKEHAKWILFPVYSPSGLTWYDFAAKTRVAHSTRKKLLIGIVDEGGSVTYYEINWIKP